MTYQEITEIKPSSSIEEDHNGKIYLETWAGFASSSGIYGKKETKKKADGTIMAHIIAAAVDDTYILSQAQFNAIKFLKENEQRMQEVLLHGLLKEHPNTKEIYKDAMPKIETISDYKDTLEVGFIHIMNCEKDDHAYIGFELECSWDDEHGVGVMMHRDRLVKIGLAEESFNHWNCYDDKGTSESEHLTWKNENKEIEIDQKMWWKFWK